MRTVRLRKLLISIVIIGSACCYLLYLAANSSLVYYCSVDEFVQNRLSDPSQEPASGVVKGGSAAVRLAGRVKAGSIRQDVEKMRLWFELSGSNHSVAVGYSGAAPANFAAGSEVLVEGRPGGEGEFEASRIMTRCESKYRSRLRQ